MWKRLALKINILFNFLRMGAYAKQLLGEQALQVHDQPSSSSQEFQLIDLPPRFQKIISFQGLNWVVGKTLPPGEGKKDQQHFTHDPLMCQHPSHLMKARGGKDNNKWWTCAACGSRFERTLLKDYEPQMGSLTTDQDLITFGRLMGQTYRHAWDHHQPYCQWILRTAEEGDSHPQLKRLAMYIAQMETQFGFKEIPAGRLDEEL